MAEAGTRRGRAVADVSELTCATCSYDPAAWTRQDVVQTLAMAEQLVETALETPPGVEIDAATRAATDEVVLALAEDFAVLRNASDDDAHVSRAPKRDELGEQAASLVGHLRALRGRHWEVEVIPEEREPTTRDRAVRELCHRVIHSLHDLAMVRAATSVEPVQRGTLVQISRSGGGVPKTAVSSAIIDPSGVVGDVQSTRKHHGRPWQAVCLYSAEVIDALRSEGHPISAGASGENLTLSGIDWSVLRGGLLVEIGAVRLRLSAPAIPCAKNNQWFGDGDSRRIHHDLHPGWGRWYATVLRGGEIVDGAGVIVRIDG